MWFPILQSIGSATMRDNVAELRFEKIDDKLVKPNLRSKKDDGDSDNIGYDCKPFGFALIEAPPLLDAKV